MTKKTETIKLLVLHESPDDAEQLMNLIRNSGRATRGQMIEDLEGFVQALNSSTWDLMLLRPEANDVFAMECLKEVKKNAKDIPAILLLDDNDPEEIVDGLRDGYEDVVQKDDQARLVLVIQRELRNLSERRARRTAEIHLKEAEKRCASLLDSSRDAITYITDGMHTYANEAYLELFGYEDADDLEGMPIMDMVSPKDHEEFKQFLRAYSAGESDTNEFLCHGLCTDGTEIQARMIFSSATYDGEPCTQILIRTNQADAELQERLKEISSQDLLTGLYNRNHFTQELDASIQWAITSNHSAVLLYIQLDNFASVQSDIGIAAADMVLADVATLLREQLPGGEVLARFGDDIFTVLIKEKNLEEGRLLAEKLRSGVEDHLSEVQDRTVQVTASIGVTLISENTEDGEEVITRAHQASEQVYEDKPLGNGVSVFDPAEAKKVDPSDTGAVLQDAIDKGKFKLLFQPVIDLRGGSGELYEAFLRMVDD
ncbi:MAG: diguanylate cyclase, partial [Ketobacter sp.]